MKIKKRDFKPRVLVALSGGVDSSAAAMLLKKQGYELIGAFLKFWKDPKCKFGKENICCNQAALLSARKVASELKIPFYVFDVSKEFKEKVVDYYINEYDSGRTPNPCVMCNKFIKFGWLLEKAKEMGAKFIAAGHYACIVRKFKDGIQNVRLLKAKDEKKDQSYFLWQLSQNQLRHILFPIGEYTKPEVRKMASRFGLETANKKESQNICFVSDNDNSAFLTRYLKEFNRPGNVVDSKGNILGKHQGLAYHTIGQRHGLKNIQLKDKDTGFKKAYVLKLNTEKNEIVVGEEKSLYTRSLVAEKVNWINTSKSRFSINAKIRYGHKSAKCKIVNVFSQNKVKVVFDEPQRAVTPGQSVVFYKGEDLIGGAVIK